MLAYYINKGHDLQKLIDLGYYEKMFYIASMHKLHDEDIDEKIALNPFLTRK
ncbi:hypothetical protein [Clostridium beijerinckii]|jgi:hypothetical protein|uniref:hypothetical protein n=1 Tax=Clostridium beijerinckii TaxID=1520 RepID=UPI0005A35F5C|nr:hypothetical protein [Clostridium beijerinckii]MBA8935524.1 hypothetical protein [Clostridium beijerinckii]NRU39919.1 hypothetical protein [Clostridium beijerinckii]NSA96802.1 hypothetical protein [Clostridium beijerinckii]CUU47343.1 conserved protein of unknown function [Clostridium beijerinckii]